MNITNYEDRNTKQLLDYLYKRLPSDLISDLFDQVYVCDVTSIGKIFEYFIELVDDVQVPIYTDEECDDLLREFMCQFPHIVTISPRYDIIGCDANAYYFTLSDDENVYMIDADPYMSTVTSNEIIEFVYRKIRPYPIPGLSIRKRSAGGSHLVETRVRITTISNSHNINTITARAPMLKHIALNEVFNQLPVDLIQTVYDDAYVYVITRIGFIFDAIEETIGFTDELYNKVLSDFKDAFPQYVRVANHARTGTRFYGSAYYFTLDKYDTIYVAHICDKSFHTNNRLVDFFTTRNIEISNAVVIRKISEVACSCGDNHINM